MKSILAIFVAILCSLSTYSQENVHFSEGKLFRGGLDLGVNFSTVNGDKRSGYSHLGLNVGGTVYWKFNQDKHWVGNIGLMYSEKGAKTTLKQGSAIGDFLETYAIHTNYVQIPLMLHYIVNEKYMIGIGGAFNYLVNHKEYYDDPYGSFDLTNYPGLKFENTTYDIRFAVSYLFSQNWILTGKYEYGLKPIRYFENSFGDYLSDRDQYNSLFQFSLTYLF